MDTRRTPETILDDIASIRTLERGRLCDMRTAAGRVYHNLQFWSDGRNRSEYVKGSELETVREAVANWCRFRELTDEYASALEQRTRKARKVVPEDHQKGGSVSRRRRPPAQR
jgi:hypothetical protein